MARNKETIFQYDFMKITNILCDYLSIPLSKRKLIHMSESRSHKEAGSVIPFYNKLGELTRIHLVVSTYGQDIPEQLLALCHEMIHVKQYVLGEVVRIHKKGGNGDSIKWRFHRKYLRSNSQNKILEKTYVSKYMGKNVEKLTEIDGPLEKEAYGREEELLGVITSRDTIEGYSGDDRAVA